MTIPYRTVTNPSPADVRAVVSILSDPSALSGVAALPPYPLPLRQVIGPPLPITSPGSRRSAPSTSEDSASAAVGPWDGRPLGVKACMWPYCPLPRVPDQSGKLDRP
ncbi:hypothetical protein BDV59DRAFT_183581 [Aspergillus ambiguus]|uniref:uncharacterized protein n=1 Tax=Aspergillus ambiguus TaxID=176160 RepID=UPI003CCD5B02